MSAALVSPLSALTDNCHFDDSILEEYSLGMLSSDMTAEVEEHVICCSQCAERMELEQEWTNCFKAILQYGIPTAVQFLHPTV